MLPGKPFDAVRFLADRVGEGRLRQAGLWGEKARWPAIAFRPLIFLLPGFASAEFRLVRAPRATEPKAIRYGHLKWPWWWACEDARVRCVTVVEGPIDLLSRVELGLRRGEAVMALPGAGSWKPVWFTEIARRHGGVAFCIALDADAAGRQACEAIGRSLAEHTLPFEVEAPSEGSDWNNVLLARRTKTALAV